MKLFYKYYSIDNYFKQIAETNKMNLRFFVKNKNQLYITITGIRKYKQLALYTQINIEKQYFDVDKQQVRKNHNNFFKLNAYLINYKTKIENWYLEFLEVHPKFEYDYFTAELKNFLSNADDKSFFSVFDDYVSYKKNIVAPSTLQNYNSLRFHLFEFQKATKYMLNFDTINFDFFTKFQVYCINQNLTDNYSKKLIKTLSAFLNHCNEKELCKTEKHKKFAAKIKVEKVVSHTISFKEFEIIKNSKPTSRTLEKVKDCFLFLAYSGFRINEIRMINKEMIDKIPNTQFYSIKLLQKKTGNILESAVIHQKAMDILQRNDYFQNLMSDQRVNIYLKQLARELNLDRSLITLKKSGGESISETKKLYDIFSSHFGRRFFVSFLKSQNANNSIIAANTGHSNNDMINLYDKRTEIEKNVSYLQGLELFNN